MRPRSAAAFPAAAVLAAALAVALAAPMFAAPPAPPPFTPPWKALSDSLFRAGEFARSDSFAALVLGAEPDEAHALARRGTVALFENRLPDARRWLTAAIARNPLDTLSRARLAESWLREDDAARAAALFQALGRTGRAATYGSFGDRKPYRITGDTTSVPFEQIDPLPVLQLSVNGRDPIHVLLDTGGAELLLDSTYAAQAGLRTFGADTGTFAGDKRAAVFHATVESLALGGVTLRGVPVVLQDTRRYAAVGGGRKIDGVLGTVVLEHFLCTLDYARGALVLRPRGAAASAAAAARARANGSIVIPFWMSGDHFMVARGTLDSSPPLLWFLDTGLAGAAFTCPAATLRDAGIEVPVSMTSEGMGGGGRIGAAPIAIQHITLGGAEADGLLGFYGPFPPSLEYGQGYRIAGILSHAFLRNYSVTFDFDAMRIYLEPRPKR